MMSSLDIEKGKIGELKTIYALKHYLDGGQYFVLNFLVIPNGEWTSQLDHTIISKYGIFVIETKYTNSWLYGAQNQPRWTEVYHAKRFSFSNPLYQNYSHTQALAKFLKIDKHKIFSVVVFWGDCQFETNMPSNVVKGNSIIKYINSKKQILLTDPEKNKIVDQLITLKIKEPVTAILDHNESVRKRYESNTICPKCGGNLTMHTAHKGIYLGEKFLGCNNFPRCHYKKALN